MHSPHVTSSSSIDDQLRYLDDFLREGGQAPIAEDPHREAMQRARVLLAEALALIAAIPDF